MKRMVMINKNSYIIYKKGEDYDNFAYDGKAIIFEKNGKLVDVYSIDKIIGSRVYNEEKED